MNALSIGAAVPAKDFDAVVHSVFTRAVNLKLKDSSHLLTLTRVDEADLPQGIRLNTPPDFSFEMLHSGDHFTSRSGILSSIAARLTIDLRLAQRWKCNLKTLAVSLEDVSTLDAWQHAVTIVNHYRRLAETQDPVAQSIACKMNQLTTGLVAATSTMNHLAAIENAAELIGLGPGLTPAGDDFLVGYLAGLWSTAGRIPERIQFVTNLGRAVARLSRCTNEISGTYLTHAAHARVSSRLLDLARVIKQGQGSADLHQVTLLSLQVGHTSGLEATTGLLQGLAAWNGRLTDPTLGSS